LDERNEGGFLKKENDIRATKIFQFGDPLLTIYSFKIFIYLLFNEMKSMAP